MGSKSKALLAAALFFLSLGTYAQDSDDDYFYVVSPEGEPTFTQRIRWQPDSNALRYEVILYGEGGETLDRFHTEGSFVDLQLKPGSYSYELITYNLLDQAEFTVGPVELIVEKAEIPLLQSVSPSAFYLESEAAKRLTLDGRDLLEGAEVELVDLADKTGRTTVPGTVIKSDGGRTLVAEFPREALRYGNYTVRVRNPGGLEALAENALKVGYQKPVDYFASAGYRPFFPLYDPYYRTNWDDPFYPLGAEAGAGLYFLKRRNVFLGAEAGAAVRYSHGGIPEATIVTVETSLGVQGVFAYKFGNSYRLVARLGGGVSRQSLTFDYEGTLGDSMTTDDPYVSAGLSGQRFFGKHVFAELGAEWSNIFRKSYVEGSVSPRLAAGVYY